MSMAVAIVCYDDKCNIIMLLIKATIDYSLMIMLMLFHDALQRDVLLKQNEIGSLVIKVMTGHYRLHCYIHSFTVRWLLVFTGLFFFHYQNEIRIWIEIGKWNELEIDFVPKELFFAVTFDYLYSEEISRQTAKSTHVSHNPVT